MALTLEQLQKATKYRTSQMASVRLVIEKATGKKYEDLKKVENHSLKNIRLV